MRELAILAGRHLRTIVRTRAARVLVLVYVLGMLAAIWLPGGGTRVGGTIAMASLIALSLLVFGVAAGAGNGLPTDRRTGRHEWLITTAPAPWKHRVALVFAGSALAVAVGLGGGLVAGLGSTMWAGAFEMRDALVLDVPPPRAGKTAHLAVAPSADEPGPAWTLPLPGDRVADEPVVELEIRPLYKSRGYNDYVNVLWATDQGMGGRLHKSVWAPIQIRVPAEAKVLTLRALDTKVGVRIRRARLLTGGHPAILGLALAGVLLGLMAAAAAPVAVFISRFTSGATAGGAAFVLLIYGAVKTPLFAFLETIRVQGAAAYAMDVLAAASRLAPDLDLIHVIGESTAGRMLDTGSLEFLPPVLVYFVIGTLLAAAPVPARWAERKLT
ncbi:MAG: hypothetical protein QNJ98_20275 [Planctomycetota bacterium]|nr:hypothetical protein [Planctomycetota bacterium]